MDNRKETTAAVREDYLDYAKAIGIFLVVWAHVITWRDGNQMIKQIIYHFHMPLFFIISGITLTMNEKKAQLPFKEYLKKDLKTLMLPCVIWSIIYTIIEVYNKIVKGQSVPLILEKKIWAVLTFRGIAPIWFLGALFLSKLFFEIFMRTVNKKRSRILTCICIAVLVVCFNYGMHYFRSAKFSGIPEEYMVTSVVRFFVCTVFLMVGYMVGLYRELLMKYAGQFFLFFGSAFWLCWYHMGCRVNIQMLTIGSMRNLLVLGVLGSLMTILFCMILPKDLPLNKIGRASLDIMVLHCAPMPFVDWEIALFKKAKFIPTPFWIALVLLMFCYALRCYFMEPARKILRGRRDGNLDRDLSGTAR